MRSSFLKVVTVILISGLLVRFLWASSSDIIGMTIKAVKLADGQQVCKVKLNPDVKVKKGDKIYFYTASSYKGSGIVTLSLKGYVFVKMEDGSCEPGLSARLKEMRGTNTVSTNSSRTDTTKTEVKELPPIELPAPAESSYDPYSDIHIPMDKINDGMNYYSKILADHTVVIKYGGRKKPHQVKIDFNSLVNLYYSYESYRTYQDSMEMLNNYDYGYLNTMFLLSLLSQAINTFRGNNPSSMTPPGMPQIETGPSPMEVLTPQPRESYIMVVYLDEDLAMGRTVFHAFKETIYDEAYLKRYYLNLIQRTHIDQMAIFQVEVFNGALAPLRLAPFAYRMYLIGPDGKRYKAIKYDPKLDTEIPPGGKVKGFVYFPKYDMVTGEELTRGEVKISIEEIGPIKQRIIKFH